MKRQPPKITILIADDDKGLRNNAAALLEGPRVKVYQAATVEAALRLMKKREFDLVLTKYCFSEDNENMTTLDFSEDIADVKNGLDLLREGGQLPGSQKRTRFWMWSEAWTNNIWYVAQVFGATRFLKRPTEAQRVQELKSFLEKEFALA